MTVNELRYFIFENYCRRIGFSKGNSSYSMKHHEKRFTIRKKYLILIMLKNTSNNI